MPSLDLVALVRNRTMSPEMAGVLEATALERRSFLTVAIPRMAGKSTVMAAVLDRVPEGTAVRVLESHPRDLEALGSHPATGYLVIPEIAPYEAAPGYIWGENVRRVFALLDSGYSLATALHAPGVNEAFAEICGANEVPDAHAAHLQLMIYIRSIGPWATPERRVVAAVYELLGVTDGRPEARLLHRWDETTDRFEAVNSPIRLGSTVDLDAATTRFAHEAGEAKR
jgi:hypothetical protein